MKKFISFLILAAVLFTVPALAQTAPTKTNPNYKPFPYCQAGQMLNTSNSSNYFGQTAGSFLDTLSAATTKYFTFAQYGTSTYVPIGIPDEANLSIHVNITKISGTVAGTAILQESMNGTNWATVSSTLAPRVVFGDSSISFTWDGVKYSPYYRTAVTTSAGTMSVSARSDYYIQKKHLVSTSN